MGTDLVIEVIHADSELAEAAIDAAVAELKRVEDLMTDWRPSPLMDLNAKAGEGWVQVPRELAELIERSLAVAELTGGAFDPTYASVGKLWDFKAKPPRIPSDEDIAAALPLIDYRKVQVDLEGSRVLLPAGTRIGLGGIAKGYGVDRAMKVIMDRGIQLPRQTPGGDLKALGDKKGTPGASPSNTPANWTPPSP
ncbi:MAG: FAD:protein FMN transferase [Planctomycetota bacterium]